MRKPPTPRIVTLVVLTTVTVVLWIFMSVYSILIGKKEIDIPQQLLEPLDPTLDAEIMKDLPNKTFYEEGQETPFSVSLDLPSPVASDSAN